MKLTIDNRELETDEPLTIYQAAKRVGIDIPVMCYKEGYDYFTSCMICVVMDRKTGRTHPSCSAQIADGMEIETDCEEIREQRKSTLELLLSEHVGDCEAPCQRLCAIHSEIPRMIRAIKENKMDDAIATIRRDMALPSILERFCNAPCEKGCRRSMYDEGVSIRHLTLHVADWDLQRENRHVPPRAELSDKRVAIVGSGASGLAMAYYLALLGHSCLVYEQADRIGGRLNTEHDEVSLPQWVKDGEVQLLRRLGVEFELGIRIGFDVPMDDIRKQFDALVLTCGKVGPEVFATLGVDGNEKGLKVTPKTGMATVEGVFGAGSVVKEGQAMLKLVQGAKGIAHCVDQSLRGEPVRGIVEMYNHNMGRLQEGEIETFLAEANPIDRVKPENLAENGFSREEAEEEATRCMHCDCREKDNCELRINSDRYGAKQTGFKGEERAKYEHVNQNAGAVYEPGKCIKCGLCVRVTKAEGEELGFTFVGRGFDLKTGVSLDKTLDKGLEKVAEQVVEACPTGALAKNEKYQPKGPATLPSDDQSTASASAISAD